jgi:hypothetical protein
LLNRNKKQSSETLEQLSGWNQHPLGSSSDYTRHLPVVPDLPVR